MEQEVQGLIPALGRPFFTFFYMDTKEIEVMKNLRTIRHGHFFGRRSIGPLPSCLFLAPPSTFVNVMNQLILILLSAFFFGQSGEGGPPPDVDIMSGCPLIAIVVAVGTNRSR